MGPIPGCSGCFSRARVRKCWRTLKIPPVVEMNREPYTPACLVAQVYVWRVQHQNSSFDDCPRSHYRVLPFTLPLSLNESPVKAFQDVVPGFSSSSKDVATLLKGLISLLFKGGTIVTSLSEYWVYFKLGLAIDFCIPVFSKKAPAYS